MKRDGTAHLLRPSDIRTYPIFYIELIYAVSSIFGGIVVLTTNVNLNLPGSTAAVWELAGSDAGIVALGVLFLLMGLGGLYALFKGGFKWRARVMMAQFAGRLYVTIGVVSVFGLFPASWLPGFILALIAAVIYLRVRYEARVSGH